ncbi:MAG: hypothetical protein ACI841_003835 [Planctomycetota bacterium]|jgi:hypothetical protein
MRLRVPSAGVETVPDEEDQGIPSCRHALHALAVTEEEPPYWRQCVSPLESPATVITMYQLLPTPPLVAFAGAALALSLAAVEVNAASLQSGCETVNIDEDFHDVNGLHDELWGTNNNGSFGVGQELSIGNPNAFQQATHSLVFITMAVAHWLGSEPDSPALVPIVDVRFDYDFKVVAGGGF